MILREVGIDDHNIFGGSCCDNRVTLEPLICKIADQLTGFHMMASLAFNELTL